MKIYADLHIHSKYSRATSPLMNPLELTRFAKFKGINLLGTGDFTHPKYFQELKSSLSDDGTGILKSKDKMNFMLTSEVSNMYVQDGKMRRVHNLITSPDFQITAQINELLAKKGKLESDGRPIFGKYSCIEMVEDLKKISNDVHIIPCHCMTPWFGILGSKSGFDSVEECFKDQAGHIFALETGLSADPSMLWRISKLDRYSLISNSDSHSPYPWRLGREANVFECDMQYWDIINTIRNKDPRKFIETIEFFPEEGKYHYDGHKDCKISLKPQEARKFGNICPVCNKPLTIGVLHRVDELADREEGFKPKNTVPYRSLIPLSEIIAGALKVSVNSKKVWEEYHKLIEKFGNEFEILSEPSMSKLVGVANPRVAELIIKARNNKIKVVPGYDGEYGHPIFDEKEKISKTTIAIKKQIKLKDFLNSNKTV